MSDKLLSPTTTQSERFAEYLGSKDYFSKALKFIRGNFKPEQVFSKEALRTSARCNFKPEDIFTPEELFEWSMNHIQSVPRSIV